MPNRPEAVLLASVRHICPWTSPCGRLKCMICTLQSGHTQLFPGPLTSAILDFSATWPVYWTSDFHSQKLPDSSTLYKSTLFRFPTTSTSIFWAPLPFYMSTTLLVFSLSRQVDDKHGNFCMCSCPLYLLFTLLPFLCCFCHYADNQYFTARIANCKNQKGQDRAAVQKH